MTNKKIVVKEWMANKIANEKSRNLSSAKVFAVIKETEKAYQVILVAQGLRSLTSWVPKSATEVEEIEGTEKETLFFDSYEEAIEEFEREMGFYR